MVRSTGSLSSESNYTIVSINYMIMFFTVQVMCDKLNKGTNLSMRRYTYYCVL